MKKIVILLSMVLLASTICPAETTEFTYQGSLQNGGSPASGNYDFEFLLYSGVTGGTQNGSTVLKQNILVANGTFSVKLDFGASFPGADRFLEIHVKQSGGGAFTPLTPRQPVTSAPYAVTSFNAINATNATNAGTAATATNAAQLGGVAANQYVTTTSGNAGYIQNQNSVFQTGNFSISGIGTAGTLRAENQFNILGNRILAVGVDGTSTYLGIGAGTLEIIGNNSFFGFNAGMNTTTGNDNAFFGTRSGASNNTGRRNSFFGKSAGSVNVGGSQNSFFGVGSGGLNTAGASNSFFGADAGLLNTFGAANTMIGWSANVASGDLVNATAIGAQASVSQSNSLVLGSINGVNGATGDTRVGIGTTSPGNRFSVVGTSDFSGNVGIGTTNPTTATGGRVLHIEGGSSALKLVATGTGGQQWEWQSTVINSVGAMNLSNLTSSTNPLTILANDKVGIGTLTPEATFTVRGGGSTLADSWTTRSSLRFKTSIQTIPDALNKVLQLRGVTFDYKANHKPSIGFIAEEVGAVLPQVVEYEENGVDAKGLDYDRITPVLVEAIKEQQKQVEAEREQIEQQRKQIENLTKIVCAMNNKAEICRQ